MRMGHSSPGGAGICYDSSNARADALLQDPGDREHDDGHLHRSKS